MIYARIEDGRVAAHIPCELVRVESIWAYVRIDGQTRRVKAAHVYPDGEAPPIQPPAKRHKSGNLRDQNKPLRPGHRFAEGGTDR